MSMTIEQMQAMIAQMQAENEKLKRENTQTREADLTMKVSEKGAVCVYGLGRFPVTLYKQQWQKLLKAAPAIEKFIEVNDKLLSVKPEKEANGEVKTQVAVQPAAIAPQPVVQGDEVPFNATA